MEKGTVCNSCGLIKPETFRCSGCKAIRYCSKECQKDRLPLFRRKRDDNY